MEHLSIFLGGSSGALSLPQIDVVWAVAPVAAQQGGPWPPHTLSRPSGSCPRIVVMTQNKAQQRRGVFGSRGSPRGDVACIVW